MQYARPSILADALAILAAGGTSMPLMGGRFRFRAGLPAWQSRNAWPISTVHLAYRPQITVLSRGAGGRTISEFLIVGCDHGWLVRIGFVRGRIRVSLRFERYLSAGSFLVRILLYLTLCAG